jgi:hypothetical protein
MFLQVDLVEVDVLVVDVLELDVLGARQTLQPPKNKTNLVYIFKLILPSFNATLVHHKRIKYFKFGSLRILKTHLQRFKP